MRKLQLHVGKNKSSLKVFEKLVKEIGNKKNIVKLIFLSGIDFTIFFHDMLKFWEIFEQIRLNSLS